MRRLSICDGAGVMGVVGEAWTMAGVEGCERTMEVAACKAAAKPSLSPTPMPTRAPLNHAVRPKPGPDYPSPLPLLSRGPNHARHRALSVPTSFRPSMCPR
jgi:hypothetical protein